MATQQLGEEKDGKRKTDETKERWESKKARKK